MLSFKILAVVVSLAVLAGCENMSKEQMGTLGGAIGGGALGAAASKFSGGAVSKTTGIAVGTAVGAAAGYGIGKYLSVHDRRKVSVASADTARSGQARIVKTEDGGVVQTTAADAPHMVAVQADQSSSTQTASTTRQCRTIHQAIMLKDGTKDEEDVTACKGQNGAWEVQNG